MNGDRFSIIHELSYELKVCDAMTSDLIAISPQESLRHAQELMRQKHISGIPVVEDGEFVGIISLENIIKALDYQYIEDPVGTWMTCEIISVQANMPLERAMSLFSHYGFGRLPVLDEKGKLIGIITHSDILVAILAKIREIADAAEEAEAERLAALNAGRQDDGAVLLECEVPAGDFARAGTISARLKREIRARGIPPAVVRRVAIATYEAETNIIIHSRGGTIRAWLYPDLIRVEAIDKGPGIPDIEKALQPGYTTATEQIRALGFGAGMGLPNIKRCADRFSLDSTPASTTLAFEIDLRRDR